MKREPINPLNHFKPRVTSQGVKVGKTVYVAGQVGSMGPGLAKRAGNGKDFGVEARQALKNIGEVVEWAGGRLSDVVELTCYMTEAEQGKQLGPAIQETFPGVKPAVTAVVVKSMANKVMGYKVEIKAMAVVD